MLVQQNAIFISGVWCGEHRQFRKEFVGPSSNLVNILSNADLQERPTADFKSVSLSRTRDNRRPRRDGLRYLGAVRDRDTLRTKNGRSVCSLEGLLNSTGLDGVVVKITPSRRQLLDRRVAVCANGELALSHVFIADFVMRSASKISPLAITYRIFSLSRICCVGSAPF